MSLTATRLATCPTTAVTILDHHDHCSPHLTSLVHCPSRSTRYQSTLEVYAYQSPQSDITVF